MTWIKICGLRRQEDAELARDLGADALGFIFEPTSTRYVGSQDWDPDWTEGLQVELIAVYGPAPAIYPSPKFKTVQASDWSKAGRLEGRAKQLVARIGPVDTTDRVLRYLSGVERLVLDAYDSKDFGGTGKRVDWDLAAEIAERSTVPVVLAGGLTAENVAEAIRRVKPFGVDVSSGVEVEPGVKDAAKLRAFIDAAKTA